MILFPEPEKERTRPLGWAEPSVHWLKASTRPEAIAARGIVNEWYREFGDEGGRLAAGLGSESDSHFHQSIDELYVDHLLRSSGYSDIRYEEGGRGPDFRVYVNSGLLFAIEVLSLFAREDWTREQLLHARLADEIDRRVGTSGGYFVHFQVRRSVGPIPPTKLANFINRAIADLPPHETVYHRLEDGERIRLSATFDQAGALVEVHFLAMRPGARALTDPDARVVGAGPVVGGAVNSALRLRDRLRGKMPSRYDLPESAPYIIATVIRDSFCSSDEILTAVYGVNGLQHARSDRTGTAIDGCFFSSDPDQPMNRRVSAVLAVERLSLPSYENSSLTLLDNPFADSPVRENLLGWQIRLP